MSAPQADRAFPPGSARPTTIPSAAYPGTACNESPVAGEVSAGCAGTFSQPGTGTDPPDRDMDARSGILAAMSRMLLAAARPRSRRAAPLAPPLTRFWRPPTAGRSERWTRSGRTRRRSSVEASSSCVVSRVAFPCSQRRALSAARPVRVPAGVALQHPRRVGHDPRRRAGRAWGMTRPRSRPGSAGSGCCWPRTACRSACAGFTSATRTWRRSRRARAPCAPISG